VTSGVDLALAALGVTLGLAAMAVDHLLGDDPGLEDPPAFAISALVVLAVAGLLFGRVVPRARDPRRAGFVVALIGVASLPLIWLGVPFAVAPAAIALGRKGEGGWRPQPSRSASSCCCWSPPRTRTTPSTSSPSPALLSPPRATEVAMVRASDPAPDFTLEGDTGEEITLSSLRGRPVVLYFYPRDDTPGS
jgi:hypothetical protein